MTTSDPQFLYMILTLPGLFGLALIGEGVSRVFHEEPAGVVSIILGFAFIVMVVFTYFFFSSYLGQRV